MRVRHRPSPRPQITPYQSITTRKFLRVPYTRNSTTETLQRITACLPFSEKVKSLQLRFFGHLARSAPDKDHHRVIAATLRPPADWNRRSGRTRTIWLRTIDEDVQCLNFGSTLHRNLAITGVVRISIKWTDYTIWICQSRNPM